MRMAFAVLSALAVATPAAAQQACNITAPYAEVSAVIRGSVLESLTTRSGPAGGHVTVGDAAGEYTRAKVVSTLYYYRVGASVPGKDWNQPGTVATEDGGFILSWPALFLDEKPVVDIIAEISIGDLKYRRHIVRDAGDSDPASLLVRLDSRLPPPLWKHDVALIADADLPAWRDAYAETTSIDVDLFDATDKLHILHINYALPKRDTMQQRLIVNVNALRKAVAEGACH